MQININAEMATFVKEEAARKGRSVNEIVEQMLSLGKYQLEYRQKQNARKAEEMKTFRALKREAQSNPEIAELLGLGKRVEVK